MKLMPYKEAIKMAKEKVNDVLAPARALKAKKQAELKMAETEEEIAAYQSEIEELCCGKDLDFDAIIETLNALGLAERRKKQFSKILKEMFPE